MNSGRLDGSALRVAWFGTFDPDSDFSHLTDSERAELWAAVRPAIKDKTVGKALIMGTGGDIDQGSFRDLFYGDNQEG